ncbi:hypothetical protein L1987_07754 [Smallanthus sonchifolius]|uniref:Uncharacterized protein n=1 Tax=Smallanthus sonchifolius TaxID=185202 RepID=A0ACB9JKH2_9ASTR|nr:hypothetical protein L1987_07754 [Smallanthus sonchifolius]
MHASIKRTAIVEASPNLYPLDPMIEDGPIAAQPQTVGTVKAADQGVTETENLSEPGGTHINGEGRTYGISDSHRKAIAERLSVSNSICSEETVNWCPGEWDYFNDLCILLGLDPDYCIEDVESDTENGTAQFFLDLMKSGRPKTNRKLAFKWFCGLDIWTVWDMGQQKTIFCLLWSWLANALKPMWVLFWHFRVDVMAQKDSPKCDIRFIREEAHVGVSLGKPMALFSAHFVGSMHGCLDIQLLYSLLAHDLPKASIVNHVCESGSMAGGNCSSAGMDGGIRVAFGSPNSPGNRGGYNLDTPGRNPFEGGILGTDQSQGRDMPMGEMSCGDTEPNSTLGSLNNPVDLAPHSDSREIGVPIDTLAGETTGTDVEMEGLQHPSRPVDAQGSDHGYGMFSPRKNRNEVQSIIWDSGNGHYSLSKRPNVSALNAQPEVHTGVNSVWNSPVSGMESFANKIKKSKGKEKERGMKIQKKKHKPVVIRHAPMQVKANMVASSQTLNGGGSRVKSHPSAVHQDVTVRGASKPAREALNSGKESSIGFNFSRAVNGRGGNTHTGQENLDPRVRLRNAVMAPNLAATSGPIPLAPGANPAIPKQPQNTPNQVITQNRFSVLDIPNILKLNKLVESNEVLSTCDMELDGELGSNVPSNIRKENAICQTNREYVEGVRILPPSLLSPPKPVHESVIAATTGIDQADPEKKSLS